MNAMLLLLSANVLTGCFGGGTETELRAYAPNVINAHVEEGGVRKVTRVTIPCGEPGAKQGPADATLEATVTGLKPVTTVVVRAAGDAGQVAMHRVGQAHFELPLAELPVVRAMSCPAAREVELVITARDLDGWTTETDPLSLDVATARSTAH